jgi:hypothetical protein
MTTNSPSPPSTNSLNTRLVELSNKLDKLSEATESNKATLDVITTTSNNLIMHMTELANHMTSMMNYMHTLDEERKQRELDALWNSDDCTVYDPKNDSVY